MSTKTKSVISASRRTDLPAFYYDWLQEALKKKEIELSNPMYPGKKYKIDLTPENVHSIVLWSKDYTNIIKNEGILKDYNLYFQYTINNYNKLLEPHVPAYYKSIKTLEALLKKHAPEQFNIRFDPIIISTNGEINPTPDKPGKARLLAFEKLCRDLNTLGMNDCKITTSYVALYNHVKKRLNKKGIKIIDLTTEQQKLFLSRMVEIATMYDLQLYSCACPVLEQVPGVNRGHCIDGELLEKLFGEKVSKAKDKGQRKDCNCIKSRDMGAYKPCGHLCTYCYNPSFK
ncbi:MAG: DUF1848 domain-containing protein [Clostridiales bacterium]|nr:DUF1848 domain-containing protein [Clostridiales bacterium]MCF8023512.1 DUF1848 domain-containing protein [Clostridiales bacterium]